MKQPVTYSNIAELLVYDKMETDIETVLAINHFTDRLPMGLRYTMSRVFALDYATRDYVFIKDSVQNMVGFHSLDFLKGGIDFLLSIYNKDDFRVYDRQVFTENVSFIQNIAPQQLEYYIFSYNFRVATKSGKEAVILQKGGFITDGNTGLPRHSYGFCMDITPFKTDHSVVHTIEKMEPDGSLLPLLTNYFHPCPDAARLSARERLIVLLLADGLSTKMIAHKLHLSGNTIANHRKNILRKTNAKNVAGLIKYAVENRIV